MSAQTFSTTELLVCVIARLLEGCRHVVVGASSPIPGSAALLTRALGGNRLRVNVLGSQRHNSFTNGGVETFDLAAQGRIDAFFLGGGQIDGEANINLVGTGEYPAGEVRWPGSFGSSYLYFLVPKVILFREEHTRRVFVPRVDFVSAPGWSAPNVHRPGGPWKMVTGLGAFSFDRERHRFRLDTVHPGHSVEEIRDNTGFDFDVPENTPQTPAPDAPTLELLRTRIRTEIGETYPKFAANF
ncbi:MAG: CoA synthetase [Betaproteobacteria bacterium]|nr:CoA synthetase [Betaproteobacteria bacterium]